MFDFNMHTSRNPSEVRSYNSDFAWKRLKSPAPRLFVKLDIQTNNLCKTYDKLHPSDKISYGKLI